MTVYIRMLCPGSILEWPTEVVQNSYRLLNVKNSSSDMLRGGKEIVADLQTISPLVCMIRWNDGETSDMQIRSYQVQTSFRLS